MTRYLHLLVATTCAAAFLTTAAHAVRDMATEEIELGYMKHAALAQLHRWYLLYEEPRYGIANQLDILDPEIRLKSSLGEGQGHDQYKERVKQIPAEWKNAHYLKSADVAVADDGTVSMTANITYLNQGMLADGSVRTADLTYTTQLKPTDTVLPKFTSIEIGQNSEGAADAFVSAYGENRMRSLVHYWLALIEDPARDAEPVREILADGFSLNFSSGAINDFEGFRAWLAGPGSAVKASTHEIGDFTHALTADGNYTITMTFDWNGILPNDAEMTAKTRHTWVVVDDPTQRFARIKTMDVEVLEPFAPKQ